MPALEESSHLQEAILWEKAGVDMHNEPLLASPREIMVRWETKKGLTVTAEGDKASLDATVFTTFNAPVGSIMCLGCLCDVVGTASGDLDADLYEVLTSDRIPDIKNREVERELGLQRFRKSLPQVG